MNPAVGGSFYWADSANGFANNNLVVKDTGSESRYAGFFSLRVGTQVHRNFDVRNRTFDLKGLRHVASVDAQYFDRFEVSQDANTFQRNDQIDELAEQNIGSVRIRNRLQTKRDGEIVDWIDWESRFLYYFEDSGPSGFRAFGLREDFAQPLQNLDFPGEDKYRSTPRRGLSMVQQRVRFALLSNLWLVGEGDYDRELREWETSLAGVQFQTGERMNWYMGRRTIRHDSIIWTVRGQYRVSDRWGFGVQASRNTTSNDRLDSKITIFRRNHDFTISMEVETEDLLDETTFSLAIYPNDWFSTSKRDPFRQRRALDYEALKWYR